MSPFNLVNFEENVRKGTLHTNSTRDLVSDTHNFLAADKKSPTSEQKIDRKILSESQSC